MHHGACLCGTIRYEIDGDIGPIVLCHCSDCRKAQGSAFAATTPVKASELRVVSGAHALKAFESSPGKQRCFCSECGSPIFSRLVSRPDVVRLRVGTLDSKVTTTPIAHIYAASKAEWFDIADHLPRYDGFEPGRTKP